MNTYKIAVPTRDEHIDDHFGHCDHYTIYTVSENRIVSKQTLPSPQGCGCKSGIAAELAACFGVYNIGVNVICDIFASLAFTAWL